MTQNFYKGFDFKSADNLIRLAVNEDAGAGDVTSSNLIPKGSRSIAEVLVKEKCTVAGLEIFKRVYKLIDRGVNVKFFIAEGMKINGRQVIGEVMGNTRSMLLGERTALNLLQRMSGIATLTDEFVQKLGNSNIKVIDTRKTTPNMRVFEKLAVRIGGGANHRMGLYDMMLIKDNHIEAAGSVSETLTHLKRIRKKLKVPVEIEVKNLSELSEVAELGGGLVDRVMLDNFPVSDIPEAVRICGGRFEIEVSGGVNLKNISRYRKVRGIDFISVGALTHSAKAVDISLDFIT